MSQSNRMRARMLGAVSVALLGAPKLVLAGVDVQLYYEDDREQWFSHAGDVTTIDFTGFSEGTVITDQYSDLGVTFTDGNDLISNSGGFPNDLWGLYSHHFSDITIEFDVPQRAIGVDFPGIIQVELYRNGQLIHQGAAFGGGGIGFFGGLIASEGFDRVVLVSDTSGYIDDVHFSRVPSPATLPIISMLIFSQRRRRR